jgi:hypothetical protein
MDSSETKTKTSARYLRVVNDRQVAVRFSGLLQFKGTLESLFGTLEQFVTGLYCFVEVADPCQHIRAPEYESNPTCNG